MKKNVVRFMNDERGLTTVEYAVAGSMIALAVVTSFKLLGVQVKAVIDNLTAAITP